jgi:hypothetical protein
MLTNIVASDSFIVILISFILTCAMALSSNLEGASGGIAGFSLRIPRVVSLLLFLVPYKKFIPICAIICQSLNYLSLVFLFVNEGFHFNVDATIVKTIVIVYSVICSVLYAIDIGTSR